MSDESIAARIERLEIPFNSSGIDPYGVSKDHLRYVLRAAEPLYRKYFRARIHDIHHVPPRGRAMLIGNHSGGIAIDAAIVFSSCFFEMDPPRLAQSMVEKFINRLPFASVLASRTGQFTGLPEHARRLLEDDRLLLVFPEGARGTAKLYSERNSLVDFGTGFVRLALQTRTPIVPFAVLGGGEAFPTILNSELLGKLVGAPYVPVTAYLLPIPTPARMEVYYAPPMVFDGNGSEEDRVIQGYVEQVKAVIAGLIEQHRGGYQPFQS
jgi:1-acyl-sn-glycerol-3-phosphate acyltransferase